MHWRSIDMVFFFFDLRCAIDMVFDCSLAGGSFGDLLSRLINCPAALAGGSFGPIFVRLCGLCGAFLILLGTL